MKKNKRKKEISFRLIWLILFIVVVILALTIIVNNIKQNKNNNVDNQKQSVQQEEQNKQEEKYVVVLDDDTKVNTSNKIKEEKQLGNLILKDIKVTYKDGITNVLANIQNNGEKTETANLKITFLDENNNEIYTMTGIIESIEAGQTGKLNSSITADFANCYDIKVEL